MFFIFEKEIKRQLSVVTGDGLTRIKVEEMKWHICEFSLELECSLPPSHNQQVTLVLSVDVSTTG